jgi:trans-aconitate 2-methyltransferase
MNLSKMTENHWNTTLYQKNHQFVWQQSQSIMELLQPQPGEHLLDLGCGTGQLTEKIAQTGVNVWGLDSSKEMINQARQNYPSLWFEVGDVRNFQVNTPLDGIFSNAVLHWVKEPDAVITCVNKALKPGGRFVAEFGGQGNIKTIIQAIVNTLEKLGYPHLCEHPWYFPSISDYSTCLEKQGFEVCYATLFSRPTPLGGGEQGMINWLQMFANGWLSQLSFEQQMQVIAQVCQQLRAKLYTNGTWTADYRRLQIMAYKC